ncbi:MAG: proton-conducting membrane transporter [Acidimicrobiaceae bacterium]|nr:proton-conducting membrane transporter [Acidimicrobiaceae bacterium]
MSPSTLFAATGGFDPLTGGEVMVAQNIAFAIMAVTMLVSAVRMVTTRNVVHAALYLVIVLAGAAGVFILLGAEFVGVTQVMVYIGAIIVLFLFGIMLTRGSFGDDDGVDGERRSMAAMVGALVLAVMAAALVDTFRDAELSRAQPSLTADVGDLIFSQYIVPFEAISVLLLAALIGAIVVARGD